MRSEGGWEKRVKISGIGGRGLVGFAARYLMAALMRWRVGEKVESVGIGSSSESEEEEEVGEVGRGVSSMEST